MVQAKVKSISCSNTCLILPGYFSFKNELPAFYSYIPPKLSPSRSFCLLVKKWAGRETIVKKLKGEEAEKLG